jgi:hypothetical protein
VDVYVFVLLAHAFVERQYRTASVLDFISLSVTGLAYFRSVTGFLKRAEGKKD